jgi:hypothetical protein
MNRSGIHDDDLDFDLNGFDTRGSFIGLAPAQIEKRVTKNDNVQDELVKRYDKLEEYRIKDDFMYSFLNSADPGFKKTYLGELMKTMIMQYGVHIEKGGLDSYDVEVLKYVVEISDDNIIKDFLWFIGLCTTPSLVEWMKFGDPINKVPPPRIASREQFSFFVRSILPEAVEETMSGDMKLEEFTRKMRYEYVRIVGIPLPPQFREMREQQMQERNIITNNNNNNA